MEQNAEVKKVQDDGKLLVGCPSDSCLKCKASAFCNNKSSYFEALNINHIDAKPGDKVLFSMPTLSTFWGIMLLFFLPLALFFLGYYILGRPSFWLGIVGFGIGGLIAHLVLKGKKNLMPKIINKVDK